MNYSELLNAPCLPHVLKKSIRKDNDKAEKWIELLGVDFIDKGSVLIALRKLSSDGFLLKNIQKSELISLTLILACNE